MAGETFVITRTISAERTYANQIILTYRIDYPQFATYESQASIREINRYYRQQASQLAREIQAKCYLEAVGEFIVRTSQGVPFVPFEFDRVFTVTYDLDCIISLYMDQYCFTGGANGVTVRTSDTWNTQTGGRIQLSELFSGDMDYPETLKGLIVQEIALREAENPGTYFENYPELVEKFFSEDQFYMTPDSLVIYFQQAQIAPHSTGVPAFPIPYHMLFILLPTC